MTARPVPTDQPTGDPMFDTVRLPDPPEKWSVVRRNCSPDDGWRYSRMDDGYWLMSRPGMPDAGVLSWPELLGRCGDDGVVGAAPLVFEVEDYSSDLKRAMIRIDKLERQLADTREHAKLGAQLASNVQAALTQFREGRESLDMRMASRRAEERDGAA